MGGVAVLCGGVGAARLLNGLVEVVPADELTAIVNVGDDMELHGLHISPDLDTVVYTVSGQVSRERGWGLEGETWQAMEMVGRYGGADWFSLGDRDLGTHLFRTDQLGRGRTLSSVTADIAGSWGLDFTILPVTDDRLRTMVTLLDEGEPGEEITFQEYFVGRQHSVPVSSVRFDGAEAATPAPGVLAALAGADRIVVAPSNPAVSIDPVLAVPGVADVLRRRREVVVAVSPIIGGKALKGPADRLLVELGRESSVVGVAGWYRDLVGTLVVDEVDRGLVGDVSALGMRAVVTETIMSEPAITRRLAETVLDQTGG
ncbi:MAG: 2-phospho-L-lactate transferase [Actinomycetota bacterium]